MGVRRPLLVAVMAVLLLAGVAGAAISVSYTLSGGTQTFTTADGDITLSGDGSGTLTAVEGPWTNTTGVSLGAGGLEYDPNDKRPILADGGMSEMNYSGADINDGEVNLRYESSGATEFTIYKLPPNVTIELVEGGSVLDTNTTTDDGVGSWTAPDGTHTTQLQADMPSEIAPLNENISASPNTGNWTNGSTNATLSTVGSYLSRIPSVAVGGTGIGASGALVLGVLVAVGIIAIPGSVAGGPVAGVVGGVAAIASVTALGLAPQWLYAVVLFVLGGVASGVIVRVWR